MALNWQNVYVFISSTFNDMHAERDYLIKRVFPDLQEWCDLRKLRLIDIDLRWGVTEADAGSKRTLKLCLQRINDCRPFFVCFLGQRSGWAPSKEEVSADTFQVFPDLEKVMRDYPHASITELEVRHAILKPLSWRDSKQSRVTDYDPAEFAFFYLREPDYLQKMTGVPRQLCMIYTDDSGFGGESEESKPRANPSTLSRLKDDIRTSGKPSVRYSAEWHADLKTPEVAMPLDCPYAEQTNIIRWRDAWNHFAQIGLKEPERSIPASKRPDAILYNAALTSGRLSNFRLTEQPDSELAVRLKQDLQTAILARFPERTTIEQTTELQKELDQQAEFVSNATTAFIERPNDFIELDEYVNSSSNQLFVLTGPAGSGRSTLLAKWIERYQITVHHDENASLHFRFIGQSDGSTTARSLLWFLFRELKEVHQKLLRPVPTDMTELWRIWPDVIKEAGQNGKTIIVLDAVDQFQSGYSDLSWLRWPLPDNIKLIISAKEDEQFHKTFKPDMNLFIRKIKPFSDKKDREALIDIYLDQYWKELDTQLLNALTNTPGGNNPLYLKVVLSELRVFGAFANLSEKIRSDFGDSPVSAFGSVLKRLENDPAYSPVQPHVAVPLLFGLLCHARYGLSVPELSGIFHQTLGITGRQMAADTIHLFLRQVRPYLARREGRYDFYYESFKNAAISRYVAEGNDEAYAKRTEQRWHSLLADFFLSQAIAIRDHRWQGPLPRGLRELLFHLQSAERWEDVVVCLREREIFDSLWPGSYGVDYHRGSIGAIDPNALQPSALSNIASQKKVGIAFSIAEVFAERAREHMKKTFSFKKPWPQMAEWMRQNDPEAFYQYRDTFYSFIRFANQAASYALEGFDDSAEARTALKAFVSKDHGVSSFLHYLSNFGHQETGLSHAIEDDADPAYANWQKLFQVVAS
jgi:hypothetical protein